MRILIWHVHGGWMDSFVQGGHQYLLPTTDARDGWGLGRGGRDWPSSAVEVAPGDLADQPLDVVVLQRPEELDEVERLTGRVPGRDLPAIYLEHNTPKSGHVPNSVHPLAGRRDIPIVHVTHFNRLYWDCGTSRTEVIEHGIVDPGLQYTGETATLGLAINEPVRRWRVTGTDLLPRFAQVAPLEVFGIGVEQLPGAVDIAADRLLIGGDVPPGELRRRLPRSRAYLHPFRWTSLGLALLEAMHLGMPVIVLGATEAFRAVPPEAGAVSSDVEELAAMARRLVHEPEEARARGLAAREFALRHYGLQPFLDAWDQLLTDISDVHEAEFLTEGSTP
ncbi:glycosyltransferase [Arthrobacter sp. JSM 101049]|uniref:glycosyltransferase n=1 Tax=Arthrobacter sp. JSM 101049 TaxID=929097 RepID=UPI00356B0A72